MKENRRSFVKRIAVSVPALTALASLVEGAEAPQTAPQTNRPSPARGRGQMDGSPVGSQFLQGHVGPAWYRNVWIRRLKGYDA